MRKLMTAIGLATLLAAPLSVAANPMTGPSYNYADFGYVHLNVDGGGSADGFGLEGSFAVTDMFHVAATYFDVSDGPLSLSSTVIGGGFNTPIAPTTDFVARVGWVNARARLSGFGSASDDGWMVQGGIRSMLMPELEVNTFVTHTDVSGSDTSIGAGIIYHFSLNFGVGASFDYSDGDVLSMFRVRINF